VSLAGPAGALSYSQHYLQPISVTLLRGIVSSGCMVGRRNRTASRASLVCMKSRNTPVVVAAPSGALKQLNLREQRIAVAFVGGSPKPPSGTNSNMKWTEQVSSSRNDSWTPRQAETCTYGPLDTG